MSTENNDCSFPSVQAQYTNECKFKEKLLANNYNAYESMAHPGMYMGLSKTGKTKKGNRVSTAMTVTHFLPRIWSHLERRKSQSKLEERRDDALSTKVTYAYVYRVMYVYIRLFITVDFFISPQCPLRRGGRKQLIYFVINLSSLLLPRVYIQVKFLQYVFALFVLF